ncbi:MAG: Gldg family protein, partial [Gammaproteobacteria bacterium]|nr:Gldg family protein [Gammaproteobacteria bacterium]
RNSLSSESVRLLLSLKEATTFTLFATPNNENIAILNSLLKRFQYHQPLINIKIINPDLSPDLLREYDIRQDGVIIIEYQQKTEKVAAVSEHNISNALQRLLRQNERWIVFLEGHGERHPFGDANHDISTFSAKLASKGFIVESLNLTRTPEIPSNTSVLVIASPQTDYLSGEVALIQHYVKQGGHLLWLTEPSKDNNLSALAEQLEIEFLPGVIVDPNSQLLGLNRVDYTIINDYPPHPITNRITSLSIFPQATAIAAQVAENQASDANNKWQTEDILLSQYQSWNETGELKERITVGDQSDETQGPLSLAIGLQRDIELEAKSITQRLIVIGDGDFLSNQFLGNGANAELGLNIMNWLSHDDSLISIQAKAAPDVDLELSDTTKVIMAIGFLIALPLLLLLIGLRIWVVRKNK